MALFRGLLDFFQNDNKLDEKTGMTGKQKKLVQNTWASVRKDEISSGMAIMTALFKQHPEYQNQFKLFKDIPLDDLPKNKRFQAHCANIISAFSNAIDQLHDPELMEATLLSLAERHKDRGQSLEHFQNLKQVLTNLLPAVFGKQYTPEVQEAWKKMLDLIFLTLAQVYKE
ncbi:hemoglobin subunit beta [Linepithema humile]|uniref:hemoglobin subunit beta n=1 Tax=Linepithema humile TaxID=83485 RepID=UPI0006234DBA|nr:PREDICTED: hemoglobin subunit beta [Linepithema humile]